MMIDLDNLKECSGCGVIFNYKIAAEPPQKMACDRDYIYKGYCPACSEDFTVF